MRATLLQAGAATVGKCSTSAVELQKIDSHGDPVLAASQRKPLVKIDVRAKG
jgi:hypothetical protein